MSRLDDRQQRLKAEFIESRACWPPLWQQVLEPSPELFEGYCGFPSAPWKTGPSPSRTLSTH